MKKPMPAAMVTLSPNLLVDAAAPDLLRMGESETPSMMSAHGIASEWSLPAPPGPLHYTMLLTSLCADICARTPELRHVDVSRVLVAMTASRNNKRSGYQAKLTPLRFAGGLASAIRRGSMYQIQRFMVGAMEIEHILSVYVPRFCNQSFDQKLITVFHELYHISPEHPGDLRRLPGGKVHHGTSQGRYDLKMAELARRYLSTRPARRRLDFLRLDFRQLCRHYGSVVGVRAPIPKLIPLDRWPDAVAVTQ